MNTRAEAIEAILDFASQEGIDNDAALATMSVMMVEMSMDSNPRTWESWDSQDLDPEKEPNNYWKSVVNRTCAYLSFDWK